MKIPLKNVFCVLFAAVSPGYSGTEVEREVICPVCGTQFYAKLSVPDQNYEIRLDLKPLASPPGPWLLPDCRVCGFVTYKLPMSASETAACRSAVASADYSNSRGRASYFRAALLYAKLGKPAFAVADAYLKASWQEELDETKLTEDLALSLKYFALCAADEKSRVEERENSRLLIGELLRRLGRFGEARAHLAGLRKTKGFVGNFFSDFIEYEISLCDRKDSSSRHDMSDVRGFSSPFLSKLKWRALKTLRMLVL